MSEPDRYFFESSTLAWETRKATLQAADAFEAVLAGDERALGPLLDSNRSLLELGVTPGIHTIEGADPDGAEKRRALKADPVRAAQWVGGQLLELIRVVDSFDAGDPSVIEEHDILLGEGGEAAMVDLSKLPRRTAELAIAHSHISTLRLLLDAE